MNLIPGQPIPPPHDLDYLSRNGIHADEPVPKGIPGSLDTTVSLNNVNIHAKLKNVGISEKYKCVEKLLDKMENKFG